MSNLKSRCVLVVDDDPMVRSVVKEAFRHDNYQICSASNGEDALALLPKISPILVLLDLRMPVMNGFQFLEHIKTMAFPPQVISSDEAVGNLSSLPFSIVVMAQIHQDHDFARCYESGITAFLKKPFNVHELKGLVSNLVSFKQNEKNLEELVIQNDQKLITTSNQLEEETAARYLAESQLNRAKILIDKTYDSQKKLIIDINQQFYSTTNQMLDKITQFTNQPLTIEQRKNLGYIKSSAYEAVDLSQSMLSLLEVNDSPSKSLSVNFDLRQLVMEMLEEQERRVGSHIFAFSTIIAPEVPTLVVGNRTIIKQLICSMIRNVFISTSSPEESQKNGIEFRIEVETLTETSAQFQLTASNQMTAANTISEKTRNVINLKLSIDQRIADIIQGKVKFEEKQGEIFYQLSTPLGWVIE